MKREWPGKAGEEIFTADERRWALMHADVGRELPGDSGEKWDPGGRG
jgi:hypothetical protein